MTEFSRGDRVRVVYETTYVEPVRNHKVDDHRVEDRDGGTFVVPYTADIELIERVDDPSKDPIGTVREGGSARNAWAKTTSNRWTLVGKVETSVADTGIQSTAHPVVGAVRYTDAWDAWQKGELKGAPEFPGAPHLRTFGEYDPNPPYGVDVVEFGRTSAAGFRYLVRSEEGWALQCEPNNNDEDPGESWEAQRDWVFEEGLGPLTEVRL